MCGPLLAALPAIFGAIGTVMSFGGQMQDYRAAQEFRQQNTVMALAAARDEQQQLGIRQMQEQDALAERLQLSHLEQAQARAEGEVAAASAGVSGISVDNILMGITRNATANRSAQTQSYRYLAQQFAMEGKATVSRAQARIHSVPEPRKPNPLNLFLGLAGQGLRVYDAFNPVGG